MRANANKNNFNLEIIAGIFDADGSLLAKVHYGKIKIISFHVNIVFGQKDISVIEMMMDQVGYKASAKISKRQHQLKSGNSSTSHSKSFAMGTIYGQKLMEIWEISPPNAPTKYLDYQIAKILARMKKESALEIVNDLLPVKISDLRIASFALLYLRYQMFGDLKENKHPKKIPIEKRYSDKKASKLEIQKSQLIGDQLLNLIRAKTQARTIIITKDYFLGIHIGDGCFTIGTTFGENGKSFSAHFWWNYTDAKENLALLEAIQAFLESQGLVFAPKALREIDNYGQLQSTTLPNAQKLIDLFDSWGASEAFSKVRLNQFLLFKEALSLYLDPDFRNNYSACSRFIDIKWKINPGTNYKKKGSLAEDHELLRKWWANKD